MAVRVRVEVNHVEIRQIGRSGGAKRAVLDAARPVVRRAQAAAPKRTGAGAASIKAEPVLKRGQWEAHVSWDRRRAWYLRFHEFGTSRGIQARHFLRRAVRGL
jgi:HK97 gp10 family phage protein